MSFLKAMCITAGSFCDGWDSIEERTFRVASVARDAVLARVRLWRL